MYKIDQVMEQVKDHNPGEGEFHQAVKEVIEDIIPFIKEKPEYEENAILERMTEPDRVIRFRVTWRDNDEKIHVNRAWRVQFNNSIGPYKGGMRFHPTVNAGILKFLGFEQCLKNALTNLPIGGAKGGSDFNPKGKSDDEIFRFCQNLMSELYRHIGENTDIPAGDIGVGKREISYLFGQYKKLTNQFTGTITGKDINFGGSLIRTEATGYGLIYFVEHMLAEKDDDLEAKEVVISGSGNVALYACQKAIELGAKVLSLSDSDGTIYDKNGIDEKKFEFIRQLKEDKGGRIKEYSDEFSCEYLEGETPWSIPCDIALPCATQNEVDAEAAQQLLDNDLLLFAEGANMPCTTEAAKLLRDSDALYAPGKASNAGGVAVSGLEISQNELRMSWSAEEVNEQLQSIMKEIHKKCKEYGEDDDGKINYGKRRKHRRVQKSSRCDAGIWTGVRKRLSFRGSEATEDSRC